MKPDGADGPHVFVADLDHLELRDEDFHHLTRSLRLRPGDTFTASDGQGSWRVCRLGASFDSGVEPDGSVIDLARPLPVITVGFALIKGGRPELVVQKLTELGVDVVVPFVAERSVVRWDSDRSVRQAERLRRVAREAAMQSRQVRLPTVAEVADFAAVAAMPGAALADPQGEPLTLEYPTVLIGPEGGWSDSERSGLPTVRLNSSILRSETASIAAATLLTAHRDGGQPTSPSSFSG